MMFWFKSRKNELSIRALEKRVKILECDGHRYEEYQLKFGEFYVGPLITIECTKCGHTKSVAVKEWREIELQQARDDFDQARDEVARLEKEASDEQS